LWGKSSQVSTASALLRHCAGPRFRKADGLKDAPENTGKQGGFGEVEQKLGALPIKK